MAAPLLPPALPAPCFHPERCAAVLIPFQPPQPLPPCPPARRVKPLRWYIMTSPATDAETKKHFRSNGFFGLKESQARVERGGGHSSCAGASAG